MRPAQQSRKVSLPAEALLTFAPKRHSITSNWRAMRVLVCKSLAAHSSSRRATLAENAGQEGAVIVQEVKKRSGNEGFNVATGQYEDLVKAGVVDPTKVTRTALQNAASISALLLTTPFPFQVAPRGYGLPSQTLTVTYRLFA
jgi:TCP-1/cpn60 chaperonin family